MFSKQIFLLIVLSQDAAGSFINPAFFAFVFYLRYFTPQNDRQPGPAHRRIARQNGSLLSSVPPQSVYCISLFRPPRRSTARCFLRALFAISVLVF